jgi:hypothetical protein
MWVLQCGGHFGLPGHNKVGLSEALKRCTHRKDFRGHEVERKQRRLLTSEKQPVMFLCVYVSVYELPACCRLGGKKLTCLNKTKNNNSSIEFKSIIITISRIFAQQ